MATEGNDNKFTPLFLKDGACSSFKYAEVAIALCLFRPAAIKNGTLAKGIRSAAPTETSSVTE